MAFVPFTSKKDQTGDATTASAAPAFSKKGAGKRRRKTGKAAPAQKALMQSGRMTGGSR